jgi:hypothetical protein
MGNYPSRPVWILVAALLLCLQSARAQSKVLNIPPVFQTTPVYCWLATGQMVFQYFGIPANGTQDYQCGEARGIGAVPTQFPAGPQSFVGPCWNNCRLPQCMTGSGTIHGIYNLIVQYPQIVARTSGNTTFFRNPSETLSSLSATRVVDEIDNGRPIIAGISPGMQFLPPGVSEHAVLIVGYESGGSVLIVNDPFPYQAAGMPPSYTRYGGQQIAQGQFRVPYQSMVGPIAWKNTISNLQANGNQPPKPNPEPQSNGGKAADTLKCSIQSTSVPWNPPGTARVRIDGQSVGSFHFGPNGSSSLKFDCTEGDHRFQFSVVGTPVSCSGTFDVDKGDTDFSPTIFVSPFGQVTCSLD